MSETLVKGPKHETETELNTRCHQQSIFLVHRPVPMNQHWSHMQDVSLETSGTFITNLKQNYLKD